MRSDLLAVLVRGGRSPGETTSLAGPDDAMPTCVGEGAGRGDVSEAIGSGGVGREAAEAVEAAASPPPSENAQEPGTAPPGTAPPGTAPSPRACCGGTSTAGGRLPVGEEAEEAAEEVAADGGGRGGSGERIARTAEVTGIHSPAPVTAPGLGGTHRPLAVARGVVTGAEAAEAAAEEGASARASFAPASTSDCTSACPQSAASSSSAASARSVPIEEEVARDEEVDGNTREGCRMARSAPRAPSPARSALREKTRRMPPARTFPA